MSTDNTTDNAFQNSRGKVVHVVQSSSRETYDVETRNWLLRRCAHCGGVSMPGRNKWGKKLGLFTTDDGEHLVHMDCWQAWRAARDEIIEKKLEGVCCVCGEPGADGDLLGIVPADSIKGSVMHLRWFPTWLEQSTCRAFVKRKNRRGEC